MYRPRPITRHNTAAYANFKQFYGANFSATTLADWPCKKYCRPKHAVLIIERGRNRDQFEFGRKVALDESVAFDIVVVFFF